MADRALGNDESTAIVPAGASRGRPGQLARTPAPADPIWTAQVARKARAESTLDVYERVWAKFTEWCTREGRATMPATAETLALYLTALGREHPWSVVLLHRAVISQAHNRAGKPSAMKDARVRESLQGLAATIGTEPNYKAAVTLDELRAMLAALDRLHARAPLLRLRNRALLLFGIAGAFRRSELAQTRAEELTFLPDGDLELRTRRRMKTNQTGAEVIIIISAAANPALCPVQAMQAWLAASGVTSGTVFHNVDRGQVVGPIDQTGGGVARLVKRCAAEAGLDAARFSGHSLRAGFVTMGLIGGVPITELMAQTRHELLETIKRYDRRIGANKPRFTKRLGM